MVADYPVPKPSTNEVLVKVLYTGVCQSDLHTAQGTAPGADGKFITNIKFPHVGGHEGVGRVIEVGATADTKNGHAPLSEVKLGQLVGIRFLSRVCHECEFCTSGREQHCGNATNHLHHEDGSFQEYCVLDREYLTVLPEGVDAASVGPVLCAGVTTYKVCTNAPLLLMLRATRRKTILHITMPESVRQLDTNEHSFAGCEERKHAKRPMGRGHWCWWRAWTSCQ